MKKSFWLIIGFLGICLALGILAFSGGFFSREKSSVAAGWFDLLFGGFDCAERIERCITKMEDCKKGVKKEAERCEKNYDSYMRRCNRYQEKAESYLPKCNETNNKCKLRAERYRDKAEQYEGTKKEQYLQKYQEYLGGCDKQYTSCQESAQKKKDHYLQKAADCREKAKSRKDDCEKKYFGRQARKIEGCTYKARQCLNGLIRRCGPLVPSI